MFPTFSEAREFKRGLSGAAKQPTTGQTVADYYDGWIDSYRGRTARGLEATTRDEYRRSFKLHVLPFPIAREKVRDVTSRDVSDWFTAMERKGVHAAEHPKGQGRDVRDDGDRSAGRRHSGQPSDRCPLRADH